MARKRVDVRRRKSPFNSQKGAKRALERLLFGLRVRHLFLSFSNEGFFTPKEIEYLLRGWGYTVRFTRPHKRYVGALIGIYNPKGEKVGKVSHTENEEYLFVATQDKRVYEELAKRAGTLQARGGEMVPLFSLGS